MAPTAMKLVNSIAKDDPTSALVVPDARRAQHAEQRHADLAGDVPRRLRLDVQRDRRPARMGRPVSSSRMKAQASPSTTRPSARAAPRAPRTRDGCRSARRSPTRASVRAASPDEQGSGDDHDRAQRRAHPGERASDPLRRAGRGLGRIRRDPRGAGGAPVGGVLGRSAESDADLSFMRPSASPRRRPTGRSSAGSRAR